MNKTYYLVTVVLVNNHNGYLGICEVVVIGLDTDNNTNEKQLGLEMNHFAQIKGKNGQVFEIKAC